MNVTKAVIVREQYLLNLNSLTTVISEKYQSFIAAKKAHLVLNKKLARVKKDPATIASEVAEMNMLVAKSDATVKKLAKIVTQSHPHLAVTIAQLRACTVEVCEAIEEWQGDLVMNRSKYTPAISSSTIIPPPYMHNSENYLVKITSDLSFLNEKVRSGAKEERTA